MQVQTFVVSPIGSNCYVLSLDESEGREAVIVDPGHIELDPVFRYIDEQGFNVVAVWNTHAHFDHVLGVDVVRQKYAVPAWLHRDDLPVWERVPAMAMRWTRTQVQPLKQPDAFWSDGEVVALGSRTFRIWHTPGHSPGSVCIIGDEIAFTGDTLFAGSIGRTDLDFSDPEAMQISLKKLLSVPEHTMLYPGHMRRTVMRDELTWNPFLTRL